MQHNLDCYIGSYSRVSHNVAKFLGYCQWINNGHLCGKKKIIKT